MQFFFVAQDNIRGLTLHFSGMLEPAAPADAASEGNSEQAPIANADAATPTVSGNDLSVACCIL